MSLNSSFIPSAVVTIDTEDVYKFIEDESQLGALNDPDALYNSMFFSPGFGAASAGWQGYFAGSGRFAWIYPGATTTMSYENGTTTTYENSAQIIGDFTGVTDGESFYQTFCTGPVPTPTTTSTPSSTSTSTSSSSSALVTATGYPVPVVITKDEIVSGYYLPSDPSVAVLSMLAFESESPAEFQAVMQTFIADAVAAGKTKLIIDLAANGGGYILQGYDAFRQLFPQIEQDGFTRYRDSEALRVMAEQFSSVIPANYSPATASDEIINIYESTPDYRYDLDLKDMHFRSEEQKFDPRMFMGDNFTSIIRWDLNDPLTTINATYGLGMEITGYGSRRNFTQPFAAENIIMVSLDLGHVSSIPFDVLTRSTALRRLLR